MCIVLFLVGDLLKSVHPDMMQFKFIFAQGQIQPRGGGATPLSSDVRTNLIIELQINLNAKISKR